MELSQLVMAAAWRLSVVDEGQLKRLQQLAAARAVLAAAGQRAGQTVEVEA